MAKTLHVTFDHATKPPATETVKPQQDERTRKLVTYALAIIAGAMLTVGVVALASSILFVAKIALVAGVAVGGIALVSHLWNKYKNYQPAFTYDFNKHIQGLTFVEVSKKYNLQRACAGRIINEGQIAVLHNQQYKLRDGLLQVLLKHKKGEAKPVHPERNFPKDQNFNQTIRGMTFEEVAARYDLAQLCKDDVISQAQLTELHEQQMALYNGLRSALVSWEESQNNNPGVKV